MWKTFCFNLFSTYFKENTEISIKCFFFLFCNNFQLQFLPKNHTNFHIFWRNYQRLLQLFILHEKFVFLWIQHEKRLSKQGSNYLILINSWKIALLEDLLKTQKFGSILNHFCWYFFSISQGNYMHWLSSEPLPPNFF